MTSARDDDHLSFSGHESFPFRITWLPKGVLAASRQADIFIDSEAPVILGVGKNMVKSIRHWCIAMNLLDTDGRSGHVRISRLGARLFLPTGWDPFLEDVGTVWLLHWLLVNKVVLASTWNLAFTRWNEPYFTRPQLLEWLERIAAQHPHVRATRSSLQRDVEVFIRSYVPSRTARGDSAEDALDCPLIELGLIDEVERGLYRFGRGHQPSLPTDMLTYAIVDYWRTQQPDQSSMSFERLQFWPGSPGAAFKLSEEALAERLELLPHWAGLVYDDTAGVRVLLRTPTSSEIFRDPMAVLERHYHHLKTQEA